MSNTAPFLHIAYANNNTGTLDFTTTGGIERTHTGFYTDEYATDSSDPTKYKWLTNAEFKNKVNTGAYANSADGTDGFTTVYPNLNLLDGTKDFSGYWINGESWINDGTYKGLTVKKRTEQWTGIHKIFTAPKDGTYTFSAYVKSSGDTATIHRFVRLNGVDYWTSDAYKILGSNFDWLRDSFTVTLKAGDTFSARYEISGEGSDSILWTAGHKWEEGSFATPYMQSASEVTTADWPKYVGFSNVTNPTGFKDYEWTLLENVPKKILNTHVAYANSSDGTTDFTTTYPNLNLLDGTKDFSGTWEGWGSSDGFKGNFLVKSQSGSGIGIFKRCIVTKDGDYTFSTWVSASAGQLPSIIIGKNRVQQANIALQNTAFDWVRVTYTLKNVKSGDEITGRIDKSSTVAGKVSVAGHKWEYGPTATPWMPSASEVTTADWPKYVGVYGDDSTTASQVPASYKWSSIQAPGSTPPVVDNLYVLTMPTVKSINVTYGIGTLTTKPVTWLSAKPKLDVNQVLWYKSEITGTDDSIGVYYSNLVGGANLDDGDSPLDNTAVSIVLNDKIINIPHDLALKLDLLAQVSDKRDNELAQAIADTNNRITNIDMVTGLEGLEQEKNERKAGDTALQTQITTNLGTETDHYNQLTARLVENEAKSGRSIIQGTAYVGSNEPSIFLDHVNKKALLRYQIPGDITYQVKELEFNYQTLMEFRDELSLTVWSKEMSDKYGGFPWRDTIVTNSDTDTLYLTGINSLFLLDGSLLIRGEVYFSDGSEAIGSMADRGFLPKYVNIVVAPDNKSVKSIRLIGKMGMIIESFSLEGTANWRVERYDNVITINNSPKLDTNTTTTGNWVNLSQKVPHGLRPQINKEICCGVLGTNNLFMIGVAPNGDLKYLQASNNATKYILGAGHSWATLNEYLPRTWQSNTKWTAR